MLVNQPDTFLVTVKTVRLGRSESLGHVESSASSKILQESPKKIWDTTDSTNELQLAPTPAPTQIVASPAVAGTLTVTVFVLKPGEMAPSLALQDGCWGVDGEMDEK